jgi:peptidoglycan/LPS O-acetylase OafA/YrhL
MPRLRIQWQARSQLNEDSIHSLLIALLRGMAALQVAAAHLRAEVFPSLRTVADPPLYYQGLAFVTGFAHQAVVVFFIISGWLVGGSLLNKLGQPQSMRGYAIDRATRLWTVLVPTMLIMVLFGIITGAVDPSRPDLYSTGDYSARNFMGNLVGLQTVLVKNFGGNYALWSLANETWYYVAFPILLLAFRNRGWLSQTCSVIALGLIAALLPWAITLYFSLWLLGAAFARIRIDCGVGMRFVLIALCAGLSVYYRVKGSNDDLVPASFVQDLVCSLPFLVLLSTLQIKLDRASPRLRSLSRFATFFSEFSFTLYVIHVPAIGLLRYLGRTTLGREQLAPGAPLDYLVYFAMLGLIVGFAYLSYLMFESRTNRVRRKLKSVLLRREPRTAQEAMLSPD